MSSAQETESTSFDYQRLLNFEIPDARHTVCARDAILYALSVGFGQDPLDERQLDYLHETRQLKVVPSAATVLGHPGFWLSDPRTGINPSSVLHGEQEIVLARPLPVRGTLIGRTRITGFVDKGPGRGAVLYSEKVLSNADTGDVVANTQMTTFLRGYGGFGGPQGPVREPHPLPASEPDFHVDLSTRPEQALLYRLNGDWNPLHVEPDVASRAGFPRPILHGLCTFGVICHALLRSLADYDASRLHHMQLRFSAPVFPGETVRVEIWKSGSFRARVLERNVVVADNGHATFH